MAADQRWSEPWHWHSYINILKSTGYISFFIIIFDYSGFFKFIEMDTYWNVSGGSFSVISGQLFILTIG